MPKDILAIIEKFLEKEPDFSLVNNPSNWRDDSGDFRLEGDYLTFLKGKDRYVLYVKKIIKVRI